MNLRTLCKALLWIGFCSGCSESEDLESGASCEEAKLNLDAHRDSLNHCESDDDCTVVGWARSSCHECGSTFQMALNTEERKKYSNTLDIVFSAECGSDAQYCDDYGDYGRVQCTEGRCGWPDYSHVSCLPSGNCNPVTQAGCAAEEKCAEKILSSEPFLAQITCVPVGEIAEGDVCVEGQPDSDMAFDNCQAGLDCFGGVCAEICGSVPDTCRPEALPFDQGEHCTANFQNHFNSETGVCSPACNPTDDTESAGTIVNVGCGANESCGFDPISVTTSCLATPEQSATQTQNEIPYGPSPGIAFSNGCASGFTTLLRSTVGTPAGTPQCARFCTPSDSYWSAANTQVGTPAGVDGKCETSALNLVGGVNDHNVAHQCRFIQGLYTDTTLSPESIGLCMPIVPNNGGDFVLSNGASAGASFGDCSLFEWEELRDVWNAAAPSGEIAANIAFDQFCLSNPSDPANSTLLPRCVGLFFGCVSLATEDEMVTPAAMLTAGHSHAKQKIAGQLRSRLGRYIELHHRQTQESRAIFTPSH